jgi:Protein of unknown function (DUF3574)
MKKYLAQGVILWTLALATLYGPIYYGAAAEAPQSGCGGVEFREPGKNHQGELFARTELYFGRSKADGSVVTEEAFRRFLDQEITPRFPNGLTLVSGTGQFRGSSGMIVREDSVLLILLYATADTQSSEKIDTIRDSYKRKFQQESVLRVDSRSCVWF